MKNLAKELNMHITTWMKGKSVHSARGTSYLAQGHWLSFIPPYISIPFLYLLSEPIPLDEVNFHMPDFHVGHTFKDYTLISLNLAFPTLISEFYASVHKHLQL